MDGGRRPRSRRRRRGAGASRALGAEAAIEHDLETTIALLERFPAALDALLRGLPAFWTNRNEGEGTFTARDAVGHLIHGERTDWMPRTRLILSCDEEQEFEPFDRWAQQRKSAAPPLAVLLDEFARLRAANLEELRGLRLGPAELARRGRHPALGSVTLAQLLATWAAHDLTHLHQLARLMAYQYRELVGPWERYLGVLRCAGHSD